MPCRTAVDFGATTGVASPPATMKLRVCFGSSAMTSAALVAGCSSSTPPAMNPEPDAGGGEITLTGTPIVATAQLGTGEALIGTTTDNLFAQVNGDPIFALRSDANGPVKTTVHQITTGWIQAENTNQLAANIAGWGIGSGALDTGNTTRYMSMRAYDVEYYEDVDLTRVAHQL